MSALDPGKIKRPVFSIVTALSTRRSATSFLDLPMAAVVVRNSAVSLVINDLFKLGYELVSSYPVDASLQSEAYQYETLRKRRS